MKVLFNRTALKYGEKIEPPAKELIKNTLGLFRASLEDAAKYGGDLTRECLSKVKLSGYRKYVTVDTKVLMLMPGFIPAILGWHTDGVPRPHKDKPDIQLQQGQEENIYHLLVTGEGCLTEFINKPLYLNLPDEPTSDLYKIMNEQVKTLPGLVSAISSIPSCQFLTWDWWNIHQAIQAKKHEWRYLIRIAETNTIQPLTDLREILRIQQQVYLPENFGW